MEVTPQQLQSPGTGEGPASGDELQRGSCSLPVSSVHTVVLSAMQPLTQTILRPQLLLLCLFPITLIITAL